MPNHWKYRFFQIGMLDHWSFAIGFNRDLGQIEFYKWCFSLYEYYNELDELLGCE